MARIPVNALLATVPALWSACAPSGVTRTSVAALARVRVQCAAARAGVAGVLSPLPPSSTTGAAADHPSDWHCLHCNCLYHYVCRQFILFTAHTHCSRGILLILRTRGCVS